MADEGAELPQVLLDRRRKLAQLRAAGIEPFPHAYPGVRPIAAVKAPHEALAAGEETGDRVALLATDQRLAHR